MQGLLLLTKPPPLVFRLPRRIPGATNPIRKNPQQENTPVSQHQQNKRQDFIIPMEEERGGGGEGSQVDDEVGVGGDGRGLGELVCLRGPLEHGVDVADVDDGLERHRAAAAEGERLAPFLGGRRRLVPLPDQRAPEPLALLLLPAARHRLGERDRSGRGLGTVEAEEAVAARVFAAGRRKDQGDDAAERLGWGLRLRFLHRMNL